MRLLSVTRKWLDGEAARTLAALPQFPHFGVSSLDMPSKSISVEQRIRQPVLLEPFADPAKHRRLGCQPQRESFIVFQTVGDKFGKPDRMKQARRHPSRERLAAACDDGQSCPQG